MTRLEWLKERQSGIGSSDSPNLVGVGFRTAADVYRSKVEPVGDRPNPLLDLGTALEQHVAERYQQAMGIPVGWPGLSGITRHPERPWQLASIDSWRDDGLPVELKTCAGFGDKWGEPGTDEIPPGYRVQVQHQMGVVGADRCDVAALCRITGELRVYRVAFDRAFFYWLTGVERCFWAKVERRDPPEPGWEAAFAEGFERFATVPGSSIDLGPEVGDLLTQRAALNRIRDEADDEVRRLTARVAALLGTNERATAGPWKVSRVNVKAAVVEQHERAASSYIRCSLGRNKQ